MSSRPPIPEGTSRSARYPTASSLTADVPPGAPPPYAFVGRMYRRPLRPIVIGFSVAAAIWCFIWGGSALWDISGDLHYLVIINIVLGILFLVVGFIEVFGLFAAVKARIGLARTYAYLSILGCLIIIAAECLRFSVYFTHKSDLITSCVSDAQGLTVIQYGSFWGSSSDQTLTQSQAQQYCNDAWTRSVWTSIIWLVVSIFLAFLYVSLAFSFYHQLLQPQRRENLAPSQAYHLENMHRGPYNPHSGYQYPAPTGPPPQRTEDYVPPYDPAKVPDYYETESGDRKVDDVKERHTPPPGLGYTGGSSVGH